METVSYSLNDIALMIKRHCHDVRNVLNGMELELTLLDEASTGAATREAIDRFRNSNTEIGRLVQALSSAYSMEPPAVLPAIQIAELWNADSGHVAPGVDLQWSSRLG